MTMVMKSLENQHGPLPGISIWGNWGEFNNQHSHYDISVKEGWKLKCCNRLTKKVPFFEKPIKVQIVLVTWGGAIYAWKDLNVSREKLVKCIFKRWSPHMMMRDQPNIIMLGLFPLKSTKMRHFPSKEFTSLWEDSRFPGDILICRLRQMLMRLWGFSQIRLR